MIESAAPISFGTAAVTVDLLSRFPNLDSYGEVKVQNASGNPAQVTIGSDVYWLDSWTVDVFCLKGQTRLVLTPFVVQTSGLTPPSSVASVFISVAGRNEIPGTYPVKLFGWSSGGVSDNAGNGPAGIVTANQDVKATGLGSPSGLMTVYAFVAVWNNVSTFGLERLRTPNIVKSNENTVGANGTITIWTPASGKSFRVQWAIVMAAANSTLILFDNAVSSIIAKVYVVANAAVPLALPFNGYVSSAPNNVLGLSSSAGTTISATAMGTEE